MDNSKNNKTEMLSPVAKYYSAKLVEHGETPHGVDWNSVESQTLRFEQLSKILNAEKTFSVNDLGCGYGALYDYLSDRFDSFSYSGIDISSEMIRAAESRYFNTKNARFILNSTPEQSADFGIASGIFNVRLDQTDDTWLSYIEKTLDHLNQTSHLGFAFNCLTSYSDADKMRDYLYYADPCGLFDLCKRRYSRNVALLHDYGLFEFTLLVRKHT